MSTTHHILYIFLLEAGLVLCWSSGFIGALIASETASIYIVLLWRFLIASILLFPFLLPFIKRKFITHIAFQALVGIFAMFGYLATGVKAIDIGVPTGTAALVGPILNEYVSFRQWGGLFMGLAGITLAIYGELGTAPLLGYGLSFFSILSIVIATLMTKKSKLNLPLLPTLATQSIISSILFLILALSLQGTGIPEASNAFWYAVIWFVIFSTIGAYGLYWACLKNMSATKVSSLIYLIPPVTMIWAWLMFGEIIYPTAILGFIICMLGVFLTRKTDNQL